MKLILFTLFLSSYLFANVTFFVGTDAHYGKKQLTKNEETNKQAIYDMNKLPKTPFPKKLGGKVQAPRGVILTGDLTDAGGYLQWNGLSIFRWLSWDGFVSDYGLNGESLLNFPVFEGYGNHDDLSWFKWVKSSIKKRNLQRAEKLNISDNGFHYSWNWDGIHFVQLNIYPGNTDEAENSLEFLKQDLLFNLENQKMPVIIFHHFGFDGYSDDWWSNKERQTYYDLIKDYNIAAIFQGHQHDIFHLKWKNIDVFSSGDIQSNEYMVCSIDKNILKIAVRKSGKWNKKFCFTKQINYIPN